MREWQRLSHVKWYCRYHVVIVPKYRKKVIFGTLRKGIGKILRELCEQEGIELVEGRAMSDHEGPLGGGLHQTTRYAGGY